MNEKRFIELKRGVIVMDTNDKSFLENPQNFTIYYQGLRSDVPNNISKSCCECKFGHFYKDYYNDIEGAIPYSNTSLQSAIDRLEKNIGKHINNIIIYRQKNLQFNNE